MKARSDGDQQGMLSRQQIHQSMALYHSITSDIVAKRGRKLEEG